MFGNCRLRPIDHALGPHFQKQTKQKYQDESQEGSGMTYLWPSAHCLAELVLNNPGCMSLSCSPHSQQRSGSIFIWNSTVIYFRVSDINIKLTREIVSFITNKKMQNRHHQQRDATTSRQIIILLGWYLQKTTVSRAHLYKLYAADTVL